MPPSSDRAAPRQEAAREMMQEVASVLSHGELGRLAEMLNTASDRLTAKSHAGGTSSMVIIAAPPPDESVESRVRAPRLPLSRAYSKSLFASTL